MRDIPIDVYLSFPSPNFDDPQTRGPALVIVNSIFISLVIIAVALRIYTRVYIKRWFGSDDYFICAALVRDLQRHAYVQLEGLSIGPPCRTDLSTHNPRGFY